MKFAVIFALASLSASLSIPYDSIPNFATKLKGEALRDYVNDIQSLWKAEMPTFDRSKNLMAIKHTKLPLTAEFAEVVVADSIPEAFDARTAWPNCPSIGQIRDQSTCGSCWAFGAAEAMSDRICITKGINVTLSADDLLSCCGSSCGYGCEGGYPINAWQWWVKEGLCTGGGFYENSFCKPYPIQPCGKTTDDNGESHYHFCRGGLETETPACQNSCSNKDYAISYKNDKHFGKSAYAIPQNIDAIKTEIMTNGPVEVAFTVYDDFYYYTSGIYKHVSGGVDGGHAVKILGWGTENGTPYWIVANSWNASWGEKGFFRIVLGTNECGIEEAVVAGLAK